MVDPSLWPHSDQMDRRTLDDMRQFAARTVKGLMFATLDGNEQQQLDANINQEIEEWRAAFPHVNGFAEREETIDWPDGNTRIELPVDYSELGEGARAALLDDTGAEIDLLEIVQKQAWEHDLQYGGRPKYDNRLTPIAFLHGISDNGRRLLEIKPTPTTALKIRLWYHALANKLANPSDALEAPVGMHGGIETGAASRFALFCNTEKWQALRVEAERQKQTFKLPSRTERKRPGRLLSFQEAGGYEAFEFPDKTNIAR